MKKNHKQILDITALGQINCVTVKLVEKLRCISKAVFMQKRKVH